MKISAISAYRQKCHIGTPLPITQQGNVNHFRLRIWGMYDYRLNNTIFWDRMWARITHTQYRIFIWALWWGKCPRSFSVD